jgi:O-antigen/teichoic acid export membrane protein
MSLGQSIRTGVKWLAFGRVGNRLFEFAFGIALARLLVPADFGMIATIQIFTGFVGMFVAGGMGQSLIRAKQADLDDFTAVFTLQLAVGLCVYLAFFFCAPLVARFFQEPLYTDLIRVSALSFLLRPLAAMRNAWLNREMDFKSRTIVEVGIGFISGAIAVSFAFVGLGVWSLVLSGLIGALLSNFWLTRLTPFAPRLNVDIARMRKHASYGAQIVGNDVVNYLRSQSRIFILSKLAGPTFLGLFNKADSLSRLPNQLLMAPTMEPLFRAMSKTQDDLEQVKHLYYRSITLLMAYTAPAYVLLWWVAAPFITVVYGSQWTEAGRPMAILTLAGFFLNVALPSSVLLAVRDRLKKEMLATFLNIPITAGGCLVGLKWGLEGVAWAVVVAQAVLAGQFFWCVLGALPTRGADLLKAVKPGLLLALLTFFVLAAVDQLFSPDEKPHPAIYLVAMSTVGIGSTLLGFFLLPLADLRSESSRWRAFAADRWAAMRASRD